MLKKKYCRDLKRLVSGRISHSLLARRLLHRIFSLYLSIAFIITISQLALQYKNELDNLQKEISTTVQLLLPTLAETLWNVDDNGVKTVIKSLMQNSAIVDVRLDTDTPTTVDLVLPNASNTVGHESRKPETADRHNIFFNWHYEQRFLIQ